MRTIIGGLAFASLATLAPAAEADTLNGILDKMGPSVHSSGKTADALEFCLGLGMGEWFLPTTLRGEGQRLIYIGTDDGATIVFSAVLVREEDGRRAISFYAPKAWARRTEALIQSCI